MDLLEIFGVGTNLMFSLGIIFIIVFTLFYLRQRLSDYDSKLKDMIQIISGLNNEIKNIKATSIPYSGNLDNVNQYSQEPNGESKKVQLTTNNYTNVIESDEVIEEENNFYVNVDKDNDNENDSDEDSDDEDSDEDCDEDCDEENSEEDNEEEEEVEVEEVEVEEEGEGENVKEIAGLEDNLEKQVSSLLDKNENTRTVDLSEVVEESKNEDDENVKLNKMTIIELREYAVLKNIAIDPKIKKKSELVELLESTVESTI